jgi:ribose transport system ATP-binding protein
MVRMMIGRDVSQFYEKSDNVPGSPVLELQGPAHQRLSRTIASISDLRAGEITCLAGLVGAGRTELARAIFGIDPLSDGKSSSNGREALKGNSVPEAIARDCALVPEDRKEQGLFLDFPICENIACHAMQRLVPSAGSSTGARPGLPRRRGQNSAIKASVLNVAPSAELSGGNQQKVVLAKWLAMDPKVIIFDEPTRGIDVGAKAEVYHLMQELAGQGVASS